MSLVKGRESNGKLKLQNEEAGASRNSCNLIDDRSDSVLMSC